MTHNNRSHVSNTESKALVAQKVMDVDSIETNSSNLTKKAASPTLQESESSSTHTPDTQIADVKPSFVGTPDSNERSSDEASIANSSDSYETLIITENEFSATPSRLRQGGHHVEVIRVFRAWLRENFLNPYPTKREIRILLEDAEKAGNTVRRESPIKLNVHQVSEWFSNSRRREWFELLVIADKKFGVKLVDEHMIDSPKALKRARKFRKNFVLVKSRKAIRKMLAKRNSTHNEITKKK
ncbi:MAG: hypothetical protein EXX96DRAFT_604486 [Benjaminiella poitrasii]|nr:MAG: hypothetical protein EXX96DRAFT_604486 [Benjaminiella poitrasii]